MKKTSVFLVMIAVGHLLLNSCNDTATCTKKFQRVLNAYFYTVKDGVVQDTVLWAVKAKGTIWPDSIFKTVAHKSNTQFTLSPLSDTSTIVFVFYFTKYVNKTLYDTIIIRMDTTVISPDSISITPVDSLVPHDTTIVQHPGYVDSVNFYYKRTPVMISPECGFTDNFDITGANWTHKAIDTIIITNPNLSTTDEENIQIFF